MRQMRHGVPQGRQPLGRSPSFVPGGFHGFTYQPEPSPARPASIWRQQPWAGCRVEGFILSFAPTLVFLRQVGKRKG